MKPLSDPTTEPVVSQAGVEPSENPPTDGIALCLSGGGYRAMLYHVGALWRLNELALLPVLTRVSSVSGGSIAAGVLALHWKDLLGSSPPFAQSAFVEKIVTPIRNLAGQTIDTHAVGWGLFSPWKSISDEIAGYYGQYLFGDATLQDLPDEPRFVLNATCVKTGALWRFSKRYLANWRVGMIRQPRVSLAVAVAASSAFPPFLSPTRLQLDPTAFDPNVSADMTGDEYRTEAVMADGGVYDNLGLETVWKRCKTILVSDGGLRLRDEPHPSGDWAQHSYRLIDLLCQEVSSLRQRQVVESLRAGADRCFVGSSHSDRPVRTRRSLGLSGKPHSGTGCHTHAPGQPAGCAAGTVDQLGLRFLRRGAAEVLSQGLAATERVSIPAIQGVNLIRETFMAIRNSPPPPKRRLRIYTIDPSADVSLDTAGISRCGLEIPWENLTPGQGRSYPIGEYVEVIDVDPPSDCTYDPVDLDDPHVLAQDGLQPSEGNPQFHQQMAYAVCMKTIENFEQALGRQVLWADRPKDNRGNWITPRNKRYVGRLRVYPHALRDQNAFYSPAKKALLLGYFNAPTTDPREELPGGTIFTCLSHDVIAHETTHAILDGINSRLLEATNPDMLAFHEAFADIVAVFQHFTLPCLLSDQIRRTRGDLTDGAQLLSAIAVQFGRATRRGSSLRNALGQIDKRGRRAPPDPTLLASTNEPHDRGAILLAAVFDAFVRMYENRICDLRRIATGGTGVLPKGNIHPDLVGRFAEEAVSLAQRVLMICVRAARLPAPRRHYLRRLPAGPDHGRRRYGARRFPPLPLGVHRCVPSAGHLSSRRPGLGRR